MYNLQCSEDSYLKAFITDRQGCATYSKYKTMQHYSNITVNTLDVNGSCICAYCHYNFSFYPVCVVSAIWLR